MDALDTRDLQFSEDIRRKNATAILRRMLEGSPPRPRTGYRTEGALWDYKSNCPSPSKGHEAAWADLAVDVLAFHNHRGGLIILGIDDAYEWVGATNVVDSKLFNDKIRKYLGDGIWVEFHRERIEGDQRYLGVAVVPPRGPLLERFKREAPTIDGRRAFGVGDSAIREGDSSRLLLKSEADDLARHLAVPLVGRVFAVDEPYFRVLAPDYDDFLYRAALCDEVEAGLQDPRAAVTALVGLGGMGKTALATWAVLRAYHAGAFEFIVSTTAKDRELTTSGIRGLPTELTSFGSLLDAVAEVLGFPELRTIEITNREKEVRSLLADSNGLLYVDNLETVDDRRILEFLDSLPVGTRAIVTSRRTSVRVSVRPITVDPLSRGEVDKFVALLASHPGMSYVNDLSKAERIRVGEGCDGIPLAVMWSLTRSSSASEAVASAESLSQSGRRGEELLEFCFRRVFDAMEPVERSIVELLSLFQQPLPTEAIIAGTVAKESKLLDSLEDLVDDVLVQRVFDPRYNDWCYTLLPVTRSFIRTTMRGSPDVESRIRREMSDWFEGRDVADPEDRLLVRELRQGNGAPELSLLDLAKAAERRGDNDSAERLFTDALRRNPGSAAISRNFAEFLRHRRRDIAGALSLYAQAAANSPQSGSQRSLIFREWGMLLRDSGDPDATNLAIEKFEVAVEESPNDFVARHALAVMLDRKGQYRRVIELLEPMMKAGPAIQKKSRALLLKAYDNCGEMLKAATLRQGGPLR